MKIVELDDLYPLLSRQDLFSLVRSFQNEIEAALSNKPSSLPAILNPIYKIHPKQGFGIAVSVGGTNGYASVFRIDSKGILRFLNRQAFSLPEQTSKENLFRLITQNILKIANGKKKKNFPIGIGFAYPLKPLLTHHFIDGELMYMSKGRNIEGLVGKRVGQEYHKFLIREYRIDTTITVANDAVCLLLGGGGAEVVGVIGTGLNFAYWEKRKKIAPLKLSDLPNFSQSEIVVNLESKNFNKIPGTDLRQIIDRESVDPGYSLAEKEASGAYLYKLFNAGKDKIISEKFPQLSSTDELNDIQTNSFVYPEGSDEEVKIKARLFARRLFERSTQIAAIELCGILMKIGKTKGLVPIVMEGGMFWKAKNYSTLVNLYINRILPEVIPSFARLFGSSRRGIALLACSQL